MAETFMQPTKYVVSVVTPEMTDDWWLFALNVVWQGGSWWSVERHHLYLAVNGRWSWQRRGEEDWDKAHLFGKEEALILAKRYAPDVKVNSYLARRVAAEWQQEKRARADAEQDSETGVGGSATAAPDVPQLG
jgi:hypothetical protein